MSGDAAPSNVIGIRDVYDAIAALRGEMSAQYAAQASTNVEMAKEVAYMRGKLDGWLGALRWLGPTGLAALLLGLAAMTGLIHVAPIP